MQDWGDTKRIAYRRAEVLTLLALLVQSTSTDAARPHHQLFYQIFRDYDHQMLQVLSLLALLVQKYIS